MAEDNRIGSECSTLSPDEVIARLAEQQEGVVARWQLIERGVTPREIQRRIQRHQLHGVFRGVYSVGYRALREEAYEMAAILSVGGDAVLSHETAARHWELPRLPWSRRPIHVSTTKRVRGPRPGIVCVHHVRSLGDLDIDMRHGLRVTSVERTLLDLGGTMDPWRIANMMHEAEFHDRFDRATFRELLARMRTRDDATHAVGSRAITMLDAGSAGTRSKLEARLLRALLAAGIPEPLVNVRVRVQDGTIEVDMYWPDARLCVEVDGVGHRRERSRRADARRDARLRAAGKVVVRLDVVEIDTALDEVVERVRRTLERQRGTFATDTVASCHEQLALS
jgi:very-short-patch-repair endonuclease